MSVIQFDGEADGWDRCVRERRARVHVNFDFLRCCWFYLNKVLSQIRNIEKLIPPHEKQVNFFSFIFWNFGKFQQLPHVLYLGFCVFSWKFTRNFEKKMQKNISQNMNQMQAAALNRWKTVAIVYHWDVAK